MNDQLGLFGQEVAPPLFAPRELSNGRRATSYSLFFALCPAPEDRSRCGQYVDVLRREHGSADAKSMAAERLHVSLVEVVAFTREQPPLQSLVDAAKAAAAQLRGSGAISLQFSQLESFDKHPACVLQCTADSRRQVLALRDQLRLWMKRREVKPASISSPHMTAYYDPALIAGKHDVETLTCSAPMLSLILSHKGCTEHELVAEWPLV
jgi:hypothetical protein